MSESKAYEKQIKLSKGATAAFMIPFIICVVAGYEGVAVWIFLAGAVVSWACVMTFHFKKTFS